MVDAPRLLASTPAGGEEEEPPFQFVRSKRRSTRPGRIAAAGKSFSDSSGSITGPVSGSGFAYSSTANGRARSRANGKGGGTQRAEEEEEVGRRELTDAEVASSASAAAPGSGARSTEAQVSSAEATAETSAQQHGDTARPSSMRAATIPTRIVCLGLGSPTTSRSAQIQLALLVVMRSWLKMRRASTPMGEAALNDSNPKGDRMEEAKVEAVECIAYDPVFSSVDRALLRKYDVDAACAPQASSSDVDGAPQLGTESPGASSDNPIDRYYTHPTIPTLLYMPHCDRALYEHVLTLSSPVSGPLILLSNMLSNYALASNLATTSPTLHSLIPRLKVVALPNYQGDKKASLPLVNGESADEVRMETAQFARLWDRNALRDLGFHWV
ncbi:hypothetical protein EX895_001264 [Sporisorium graminicola]|uniref:SRR1-like domain-containing protein n=1 Tax=Sporisorium graminicola TaxID=280036 RepID=A0A4U7KZW5_9BASI|nr:hypothetical protein EX895_001264 [Sporisorium graminicola]TKY89966.1 hypothetical protein EX895_001264 [Sporisorium graminicola]